MKRLSLLGVILTRKLCAMRPGFAECDLWPCGVVLSFDECRTKNERRLQRRLQGNTWENSITLLRDVHEVSKRTIEGVLKDAFAAN